MKKVDRGNIQNEAFSICLYVKCGFLFDRIKLKVTNTIRWREDLDDEGNARKESNARMVRWSDGSMSLHLGNEIFDVYKQPLQGDHNHLFIRQGTGLQGQAVFRTKLTFRPYSTESFTHKKMTMSLADRSQKTSGIKILTQVGFDPDANRYAKLKKEEEQLRAAMRQKTTTPKQKRNRETAALAYREEHDSDDEGAISIAAIKNKYTGKGGPPGAASKQGILKNVHLQSIISEFFSCSISFFLFKLQVLVSIHPMKMILTSIHGAKRNRINQKRRASWTIQMKKVAVQMLMTPAVATNSLIPAVAPVLVQDPIKFPL